MSDIAGRAQRLLEDLHAEKYIEGSMDIAKAALQAERDMTIEECRGGMSPNNTRAKAEKYRVLFAAMYRQAHLSGCKPITVTIKYSTLRDLLGFFGKLSAKQPTAPESPAAEAPHA
jgi:hypothetical protein